MTPQQLGEYFVKDYVRYTGFDSLTMSNISLSRLNEVVSALNNFSQLLIVNMATYKATLRTIRNNTQSYGGFTYSDFRDLYDFASRVKSGISNALIQDASQSLMNAISSFVVSEAHSRGGSVGNSHGISIWLPDASQYINKKSDYTDKMDFSADTYWDEFLAALWSP